jgi:hypothetical protein
MSETSNLIYYIESNCWMIHEGWRIGLDLEGSDLGLIEISSRHLTGGGEEIKMMKTTKILSHDARYPGWDSNLAPPECKYKALSLDQIIGYVIYTVTQETTTQFVTYIYDRIYI